jgi:hypothetical protein
MRIKWNAEAKAIRECLAFRDIGRNIENIEVRDKCA